MNLFYPSVKSYFKLFFFWVLFFDIQRLLFSLHNFDKVSQLDFIDFIGVFWYSIRLDLAMAAFLNLPLLVVVLLHYIVQKKWSNSIIWIIISLEIALVAFVHAGEINAYPEWNHKLTSRVFTHLLHPDEVVRTANASMTWWYIIYSILEIGIGIFLVLKIGKTSTLPPTSLKKRLLLTPIIMTFTSGTFVLIARGGFQQIPINIDAAYFSKNYVANDLSVNSFYFFGKSALLYNRSNKGSSYPKVELKRAQKLMKDLFNYPVKHDTYILNQDKPNLVFIILESWSANAIYKLTHGDRTTPFFDQLTEKGLLFSSIYASAGTSEIGHASIFSGYPSLPEVAITMQPDRHRKLPSISNDLHKKGYFTGYLFSGDLNYGNIGGYLNEHGFDDIADENDFPRGLEKGKLNYYDEDLYSLFLKRIRASKQPFLHCAFTGSTHSPYDYPKSHKQHNWPGAEADFMQSMEYADACLKKFFDQAKKESWYKNTLFVLIADHGHATNAMQDPNNMAYFHIPLLLVGEPLKETYRGKQIQKLGSQADLAKTLAYQLNLNYSHYTWSKDLLNPSSPSFALHSINRCYGWITPTGHFSKSLDYKEDLMNSFPENLKKQEVLRCHAFMSLLLNEYEN